MSGLPQLGDDDVGQEWQPESLDAALSAALRSNKTEEEAQASEAEARILQQLTQHIEIRLQRAIGAMTSHLDGLIKRSVQESHDAIAARIEDTAAAQVEQALGSCNSAGERVSALGSSDLASGDSLAGSQTTAAIQSQVTGLWQEFSTTLQRRQEEVESLVMRIATTTAKDVASARAETASELRVLGGSVRLELDKVESNLEGIRTEHEEMRTELRRDLENMLASRKLLVPREPGPLAQPGLANDDRPIPQEAIDGAVPERRLSKGSAHDSDRTEHQSPRSGPRRESSGVNALSLPKAIADSDEASADAGAGAARGGIAAQLRAAAERGEGQGNAVASLYEWFAASSGSPRNTGSDDALSTPRGRPKSKPSAVPPRELVRAAAQELVSRKNSDEGSNTDPFKMSLGSDRVEELHASSSRDVALASDRKDALSR